VVAAGQLAIGQADPLEDLGDEPDVVGAPRVGCRHHREMLVVEAELVGVPALDERHQLERLRGRAEGGHDIAARRRRERLAGRAGDRGFEPVAGFENRASPHLGGDSHRGAGEARNRGAGGHEAGIRGQRITTKRSWKLKDCASTRNM
jgi:hypothetical protein